MVIFKSKQKKFKGDLKMKLRGKQLYPTESVNYLSVKIDTNLSWQHHVNDFFIKLNRAKSLLFKMRKYVSCKIIRSINFPIFDSYFSYCYLICTQNCSTIQRIVILQKRLLEFLIFNPVKLFSTLLKQSFIVKFQDKICLENILFVSKPLKFTSATKLFFVIKQRLICN